MNRNNIKKYTFIDWTQMVPGAIIGGFIMTPGGLGLGSDWAIEMQQQQVWKRICISEYYTNLKDRLPVAKISKTGVSIYLTNGRNLSDLLIDSILENVENGQDRYRHNVSIKFTINHPIGIFLGNILRVDGLTYVNLLTLEGQEIWLCDQNF